MCDPHGVFRLDLFLLDGLGYFLCFGELTFGLIGDNLTLSDLFLSIQLVLL